MLRKSFMLAAAGVVTSSFAAMPVIEETSVSFDQNNSTRQVNVTYTLEEANAIVTVDFLTNAAPAGAAANWVSIGEKNFTNVGGDVNRIVTPGKRIVTWQPDASWPNHKLKAGEMACRLKAWDVGRSPDYMVVDLTETNAAPHFYVSTEAFPDGGLDNDIYKTAKLVMRRIPAAGVRWTMGSPENEPGRTTDGRETQHAVTFTNDYFIGIYMVSQGQQVTAIDINSAYPSHRTNDCAVINNVNYIQLRGEASEANWPQHGHHVATSSILGKWRAKTGIDFDLPTSAQWEYAVRAGSGDAFFFGQAGYGVSTTVLYPPMNAYAWYGGANGTSKGVQQLIGKKDANPWGLCDVYGNGWEWCLDWFSTAYADDDSIEPQGAQTACDANNYRVMRGGAQGSSAASCRSASIGRDKHNQNTSNGQAASWGNVYRLCCPAQLVW